MEMPENLLRILEVAGAIAVGVLALPWVFGPLLVKFSQRMRANPKLIPLDTQAFPLPQPLASSFSRDIACLEGVGFTLVSYATVPDVSPGVMSVVVILENRASQDLAMIATIFAVSRFSEITAGATPRSQHVEFSTEFSDGLNIIFNLSHY